MTARRNAERAWWAKQDELLISLRVIDPAPLVGRPEWVTYGVLREELEASKGIRTCRERLWTVHPINGVLPFYVAMAQMQPVGTYELRAQALARWRAFPRLIEAEIANLGEGVRSGYTQPKVNVPRVIESTDQLRRSRTAAATSRLAEVFAPD